MQRYGHIDGTKEHYPLAAWVWGHRLREGQNWMEYLLEFLNVLAGFDYELGQGINIGATPSTKQSYKKFTRLGLRRFIFYDEREKTRHPLDDYARQQLWETLQSLNVNSNSLTAQESLKLTRSLLQAFTAVAAQRSWYAKSLFPAHHNLLFWEALRKGATKRTSNKSTAISLTQVDKDISFNDRNFFARGGEIYYLILSAATEHDLTQRQRIATNFRRLLHEHHQALGNLASLVEQSWQGVNVPQCNGVNDPSAQGELGWIPEPQDSFYTTIAGDVDTLLQAPLDSLELLDLLAHLICFHLTLYIYYHARDGSIMPLLIDALDGTDGGGIRRVSATCYKECEAIIVQRARNYVTERVQHWLQQTSPPHLPNWIINLHREAKEHFSVGNKSKGDSFQKFVYELDNKYQQGLLNQQSVIDSFHEELLKLLLDELNEYFLGVHRKLAKSITLVAPRKGGNERFVLGDTLLKALTLAMVKPDNPLTYDQFLLQLYKRYGLVVSAEQATHAGFATHQRINADSYNRNRTALLETMKRTGLAIEYSDATAMVQGVLLGVHSV